MRGIKEFIRYVLKGLPLVSVIILSALLAVHMLDVIPPVGSIIIFITVLIMASASVGIARDIMTGE